MGEKSLAKYIRKQKSSQQNRHRSIEAHTVNQRQPNNLNPEIGKVQTQVAIRGKSKNKQGHTQRKQTYNKQAWHAKKHRGNLMQCTASSNCEHG